MCVYCHHNTNNYTDMPLSNMLICNEKEEVILPTPACFVWRVSLSTGFSLQQSLDSCGLEGIGNGPSNITYLTSCLQIYFPTVTNFICPSGANVWFLCYN